MGNKSHVIVVPFPAQGHVAPLMKLAYSLADHGIKVTFINTESIHMRIMSAMPEEFAEQCPISLVSIPEGLESKPDEQDKEEAVEIAPRSTRVHLQNLIQNINQVNNDVKVTHVVADIANGWVLEVAKKLFIKPVAFVPYGLGNLAFILHAPKLIEDGIIDVDGKFVDEIMPIRRTYFSSVWKMWYLSLTEYLQFTAGIPIKREPICLSKEIPAWNIDELTWSIQGDSEEQKFVFRNFVKTTGEYVRISDSLIVNSFYELESSASNLLPNILPIGPLIANARLGTFSGNLWPEDSTTLSWLDKQPARSVIYAAFGSTLVCNQQQFNELALGLEMTGQPFLWVVRSDFMKGDIAEYSDGFMERNESHGKIVKWAPQEKVLAHPSTACYFSHCGWNSTMEGVTNGVPFLCWPYCVDQFHNRDYICEAWKVGLRVMPNENGIVSRHEIKTKIEKLLSNKDIKANSLKLKEMARKSISEGGSSFKNFISFVEQIKQ